MHPEAATLAGGVLGGARMGGIAPDSLAGTATGVFLWVSMNEYLQRRSSRATLSIVGPHAGTGNALSIAANACPTCSA